MPEFYFTPFSHVLERYCLRTMFTQQKQKKQKNNTNQADTFIKLLFIKLSSFTKGLLLNISMYSIELHAKLEKGFAVIEP